MKSSNTQKNRPFSALDGQASILLYIEWPCELSSGLGFTVVVVTEFSSSILTNKNLWSVGTAEQGKSPSTFLSV